MHTLVSMHFAKRRKIENMQFADYTLSHVPACPCVFYLISLVQNAPKHTLDQHETQHYTSLSFFTQTSKHASQRIFNLDQHFTSLYTLYIRPFALISHRYALEEREIRSVH